MKRKVFCMIICLTAFGGCQKELQEMVSDSLEPESRLPVHYEVLINRATTVEMRNDSGENSPQTMTEELTADLFLEPVNTMQEQVVFKARCDSVGMSRSDFVGIQSDVDALRQLQGKGFTLIFSQDGDLLDDSSVKKLMKAAGKKPAKKICKGTFKEPDMMVDFYAVVVDLCATAAKKNYSQGDKFTRFEPTSTPAVEFSLPDRQITCVVDQVTNGEGVLKAKIIEVHAMAGNTQTKLEGIYSEGIKTEGLFSSLRRWRTQSIDGTGEKMVNIETSFCESSTQQWQVKATAGFAVPIKDIHPVITIDETITVKQIK